MTTTEETMTESEYITDVSRMGHTRGMAALDALGRALKNPDLVPGDVYLMWSGDALDTASPTFIVTHCGDHDGTPLFAPLGYIQQPPNEDSQPDIRTISSALAGMESRVWVTARFAPVELGEDRMQASLDRAEELRTELRAEQDWFEEFSKGMNELAETHGWCGTYDDIVRAVGLPGREKEYWVEVEARCTITDTNPSSRLDSALEEHYGSEVSTTEERFTGKATVTVHNITANGNEDASSRVSEEDVVRALREQFSARVELIDGDWEVKDTGEED